MNRIVWSTVIIDIGWEQCANLNVCRTFVIWDDDAATILPAVCSLRITGVLRTGVNELSPTRLSHVLDAPHYM